MSVAFVAGATGYTGRYVVEELRRRGARVTAHVRPDSPRLSEWRARFDALGAVTDTTPWQPAALADTLRAHAPDAVFALLGTTRLRARRAADAGRDASYAAVDRDLTLMLLAATTAAAPGARFVYLSSVGADAAARSEYLRVRGEVENVLGESGLAHIVARPVFITGPDRDERRPAERAAAIVVDALLAVAARFGGGRLRDRYAALTGEALARALVTLGLDADAPSGAYDAGALRHAARI